MTENYSEDDVADNTIPCPYCQGEMVVALGYEGVPITGKHNFRQGSCDNCGLQTPRLTTYADVVAWAAKYNGLLKLH